MAKRGENTDFGDDLSLEVVANEVLRREAEERGRFYIPNGKIEEFIREFAKMPFITAFIAANAVGKSACIAMTITALLFPDVENEYFADYDFYTNFPYVEADGITKNKYIRVISDPTTIKSGLIPELKKWLPQGRYYTDKSGKTYEGFFYSDTGWKVEFMSYDQSIKEFESVTCSIIFMDEPPPYEVYLASMTRLRLGGQIAIFFTPLLNAAWAYDEFGTKTPEELKNEGKVLITANIESNCEKHGEINSRGHRGILKHNNIVKMFRNMPADEVAARAKGEFQSLQGLILKQYSPKIHIVKPFDANPIDYCFVELLDPHPQMPDALMYIAINKNNTAFVYEEVYRNMNDLNDLAATIKKCREGKRIIASLMDPIAWNEDQHIKYANPKQKYSLAQWLKDRGIKFDKASKSRYEGIRRLQTALTYELKDGVMIRPPQCYVVETCMETNTEATHWMWDKPKKNTKSPKGTPVDKDDHMMENWGRFFLGNFKFVPMPQDYFKDKYGPLQKTMVNAVDSQTSSNQMEIY